MSSKELQAPALPTVSPEHLASRQKKRSANGRRVLACLVGATCATFIYLHGSSIELPNLLWTQAPPLGLPERIQRHWGQYSPYFPAGEYVPPPDGCDIVQVNILQRHGARFPTVIDDYPKAVKHLLSAKKYRDSSLYFLKYYQYGLQAELLTPFGAEQSFEAGEVAYRRYGHLVSSQTPPFVRASGLDRVVKSAANWTVGFAASSKHRVNPTIDQILSESANSTLNNVCPKSKEGDEEKHEWLSVFSPPILERLKKAAKGAKLTEPDVHRIMALCPFETIAYERPSPFCDLFTPDEWKYLEYYGDVEKYYKTGYGNPLGPIQGVGYINELLARLTGLPPRTDNTTHNHSLPFPLDRPLYADFTHENEMVAVFSAMGLFNISDHPLNPKKMERTRKWTASLMVPFSARMVVEKLACDVDDSRVRQRLTHCEQSGAPCLRRGGEGEDTEYVRIFVNDALQPLEFCGAEQGKRAKMCTLKEFVKSQGYARRNGDGDFEKCF